MLKAYTLYRPEEGYCQAQAPVAAVLLMHMPAEVLGHLPSFPKWRKCSAHDDGGGGGGHFLKTFFCFIFRP